MSEDSDKLEALVVSVNQVVEKLSGDLEDVQYTLDQTNARIAELPKTYIPRTEADKKADTIRNVLTGIVLAGAGIFSLVVYGIVDNGNDEDRARVACRETRSTLESVINISVADREPLPTSSAETRAAIEAQNVRIKELRDRLLSLEGTQPGKC